MYIHLLNLAEIFVIPTQTAVGEEIFWFSFPPVLFSTPNFRSFLWNSNNSQWYGYIDITVDTIIKKEKETKCKSRENTVLMRPDTTSKDLSKHKKTFVGQVTCFYMK